MVAQALGLGRRRNDRLALPVSAGEIRPFPLLPILSMSLRLSKTTIVAVTLLGGLAILGGVNFCGDPASRWRALDLSAWSEMHWSGVYQLKGITEIRSAKLA